MGLKTISTQDNIGSYIHNKINKGKIVHQHLCFLSESTYDNWR